MRIPCGMCRFERTRPGKRSAGHGKADRRRRSTVPGLANNSVEPHVLIAVGGLPEGLTVDGFIALIDAVNAGEPPPEGTFEAGAVFSKPGQDHQKLIDLTSPGQYGYFCRSSLI